MKYRPSHLCVESLAAPDHSSRDEKYALLTVQDTEARTCNTKKRHLSSESATNNSVRNVKNKECVDERNRDTTCSKKKRQKQKKKIGIEGI